MGLLKFLTSRKFFIQIAIALMVVALSVFLLSKWLDVYTNHNQKIEVPNLSKKKLNEVTNIVKGLHLNFVVIDSASYNPKYPAKSVIDQNPMAGEFVKENRKIYLTLNPSGYRKIQIPTFYGKTKRQVSAHLQSIGLKINDKSQFVPDVAKDVVRGLEYKGKKLKKGDFVVKNEEVTLILGDGNSTQRYIKPSN